MQDKFKIDDSVRVRLDSIPISEWLPPDEEAEEALKKAQAEESEKGKAN